MAAALVLAVVFPAGGEPSLQPVQAAPELKTGDQRIHILSKLYKQLRAAPNADEADVIAQAIERIWLKSGSHTVDLLIARAAAFVASEELDDACQVLDAVVGIDPTYAEAWYERAMVHFIQRDFFKAMADLRQALARDPQHFKAIAALGAVLQEVGDKKAALAAYRRALAVHPFLATARQAVEELEREVDGQGI